MRRHDLIVAMSAGVLAAGLASCSRESLSSQGSESPALTVLQWKPVEEWTELLAGPIQGQLTVWKGCAALHVTEGSAQEYMTLVWPPEPEYRIEVLDDSYQIRDESGDLRASDGDIVALTGGGNSSQYRSSISSDLVSPIPESCSAPFWIVGSLVLVPPSEQTYP